MAFQRPAMAFQRVAKFVLAVLLVILFAQSSKAVIMNDGAQTDTTWQQAYQPLGAQYPSVVALGGYNGTSWHNIGCGVVIDPYHVLTAAHVVLENSGSTFQNYVAVTGNNLVSNYWGVYYSTQAVAYPGYSGVGSTDIGVLTFSQSIDVTPAPLYTGSDPVLIGSVLTLSGFGNYGYAGGSETPLDGQKRGCESVLVELGDSMLGAPGSDQFVTFFARPSEPEYQYLGGCSANYDSGGGWFNASGQLVAINDWRAGGPNYGAATGATSVSQNSAWIQSQIVPEPGTLVLLSVAAGSFFFFRMKRASRRCRS